MYCMVCISFFELFVTLYNKATVGLDGCWSMVGVYMRAQSDWAETGNKTENVGSNSLSSIRERRLSSLRSASLS